MQIRAYHHVGIRVSDEARAIAFYELLGFRPEPGARWPEHDAISLISDEGVRINLIYNAERRPEGNVLLDEPVKWPGITHVAFEVADLQTVLGRMEECGVGITEGPVVLPGDRRVCFIRDPDGNVIEFDEILGEP